MSLYCYDDPGGFVQAPRQLPASFADVSNFYALDDARLQSYGWYPFESSVTPSYDPFSQKLLGPTYVITNGIAGDVWEVSALTNEELQEKMQVHMLSLRDAIHAHLDDVARARDYFSWETLTQFADSSIPDWVADYQAAIAWRDAVWVHAYTVIGQVQQGLRTVPTAEELIAELPTIVWPS